MLPFEKNDILELNIHDVNSEGAGVGRYEGVTVFVQGALAEETVSALIIKCAKNYAVGKLLKVLRPSVHRVDARCDTLAQCGGCTLQNWDYERQLKYKQALVKQAFERIAGLPAGLPDIIGMDSPWRYRNKNVFPAGQDDGGVYFGMFAPRSHRVVKMADCVIAPGVVWDCVNAVSRWANEYSIPAYDEHTQSGFLRHVMVRVTSEGVMAVLIAREKPRFTDDLAARLKAQIPDIKSIYLNIQPKPGNVILGSHSIKLFGDGAIHETILGKRFAIGPGSFFQVNTVQMEKLYNVICDYANLNGGEYVIDAYCGIGTIALTLAGRAGRVLGIECVEGAVENAAHNARINGIHNAKFVTGLSEKVLPGLLKDKVNLLVLDPPRKGCEKSMLDSISRSELNRVIYVSCNPATLARDVKILHEGGFCPEKITAVDMFPHTAHVECVVLMSRA